MDSSLLILAPILKDLVYCDYGLSNPNYRVYTHKIAIFGQDFWNLQKLIWHGLLEMDS